MFDLHLAILEITVQLFSILKKLYTLLVTVQDLLLFSQLWSIEVAYRSALHTDAIVNIYIFIWQIFISCIELVITL